MKKKPHTAAADTSSNEVVESPEVDETANTPDDSEGPVVQPDLDISTATPTGPVECLGQTFPSDDARRAHYLKELAAKLKDPAFRKIEGFPIGEDEDILALSDPPYYTACPNPWLADFIKHYGRPYNPKKKYHREPFAADVQENKHHPLYLAHTYHTKVPHRAIMRYILHYTEPGDVVFDCFSGTGMTGIAAQLCGDAEEVKALGYNVSSNGDILDNNGFPFSKIGPRYAVLNDLAPAATFISSNYNNDAKNQNYRAQTLRAIASLETKLGWMYKTLHAPTKKTLEAAVSHIQRMDKPDISQFPSVGTINYTIWSEVFVCNECAGEIVFWDSAVDRDNGAVREQFPCPHCKAQQTKRGMERSFVTKIDSALRSAVKQTKIVPVMINYSVGKTRFEKKPDVADIALVAKIETTPIHAWFPSGRLPEGTETRRNDPFGITHFHHFYTLRNLVVLANAWQDLPSQNAWVITGCLHRGSKQHQVAITRVGGVKEGEGGATAGHRRGTLYVPSNQVEMNALTLLRDRANAITKALSFIKRPSDVIQSTQSASSLLLPTESLDYFFLDPPFGSNIDYSELNTTTEAWLKLFSNSKADAIEDRAQGKTLAEYHRLIAACFDNVFRALKPGRWITVEFSNTQAAIWNAIQTAIQQAGFIIANVSVLNKGRGGLMAIVGPTAVKQDLVISAYKPNGGLEDRFAKESDTEKGVWDFIQTHLSNLPVVKPKGGQLDMIFERDPRILFDRTVAFYVQHNLSVPISSPEFQSGLAQKYPERDGMYFLSEQAAEYDRARMKADGIGQLTIWVEDERSAVNWLRNLLKNKPSKYQDIQPEFFAQLKESWKKWETKPELRALLEQYFLCYQGEGAVPPQIHSYLSTNFKDLRTLPADDAVLRDKARDRWFVPDPRKNADVEQLREKNLLVEFWSYLPPGYTAAARTKKPNEPDLPGLQQLPTKLPKGKRIAIVRTEAVRVGFNFCYGRNDYTTIIAVAQHIPDDVVQNDEQLQMIYDSAITRTGEVTE